MKKDVVSGDKMQVTKEEMRERAEDVKREAIQKGEKVKKHTKEIKTAVRKAAREKAKKWRRMMGAKHMCIGAVIFGLIAASLCYSGVFEEADQRVSDFIYQTIAKKRSNSKIRIISIDKETVNKYGEYKDWSREKTAALLKQLNGDRDKAPTVIGIDLDYSKEIDDGGDESLVEACREYKNICLSASLDTEGMGNEPGRPQNGPGKPENGENVPGRKNRQSLQMPFEGLSEQVTVGLVNNTRNSEDGFVRNAIFSMTVNEAEIDGFATAIYKMYMDSNGMECSQPNLDKEGYFNFTFSRKSQEYTVYSFLDVVEGKISPNAFEDCVVFVGDYTINDTFMAPNQRKVQMQEIEMQANIFEALMEQRTGQQTSKTFMAVFYAFFMSLFFIATSYSSGRWTFVIAATLNVVQLFACWVVNLFGYYVNILVPLLMIVVISIYNLIVRYAIAVQNQYALEDVFKKYVDESVINELGKDGLLEARIGVVSKDIAVLFVDIRGFTSLSESLPPEQIVEILNDYLALVAEAVANNEGTLDKFIGDAAMAVFNSPTDLEDYEYKAVCAALELRSNAESLNEKCEREYGKQVAFGIGIQCGEAVIGNIGCEMRMDYTAIGDTVNTASRLEGAAAPGQILVSKEMADRLKGRIQTLFAGEYTLKGKKNAVPAYAVQGITDGGNLYERSAEDE